MAGALLPGCPPDGRHEPSSAPTPDSPGFRKVSSIAPRQSVSVVRRSAGWGTDVPHPAGPAPPKRFARPRPAFGTTTGAGAASVPYETIGRDTTSSESAVAQPSQP